MFSFIKTHNCLQRGIERLAISGHRSGTSLRNYIGRSSSERLRACFMRVKSILTTLLFALEIKFVLKIESNTWGI